ncbi:MAG: hypothetical protein AAF388_08630 [Bacteroidota bacterium]
MEKENKTPTTMLDLEYLLRTMPFDRLSPDMQREVLKEVSAEEYGLMRQTILKSMNCFQRSEAKLQPEAAILSDLTHRVAKKKKGAWDKIRHIFTYPIPAYQAAAAIVFLGIGLNWMDTSSHTTAINGSEYNMIVDTAFVPANSVSFDLAGEDSVYKMVSPRD